jgi:hypothetical protein
LSGKSDPAKTRKKETRRRKRLTPGDKRDKQQGRKEQRNMRQKAKRYEQKAGPKGGVYLSVHAPEAVGRAVLDYVKARNEKDRVHKTTVKSFVCDAAIEFMKRNPV